MKFPTVFSRAPIRWIGLMLFVSAGIAAGCQSCAQRRIGPENASPTTSAEAAKLGLETPKYLSAVQASVAPPLDWHAEPLESSKRHAHQVWISPSGRTAYGVVRFYLPLPVGHELVLRGFLAQLRRNEGESELLSKRWDDHLNGMRFVASGGKYTVHTNLFVRGLAGWACYAGTRKNQPIESGELELAEQAREHTTFGQPPDAGTVAGPAGTPASQGTTTGRQHDRNTPDFRQEISSR